MAGCKKAGRNRKSNSNVAYKSQNRKEVNKRKRAEAGARRLEKIQKRKIRKGIVRGSARARRRKNLQSASTQSSDPLVLAQLLEEALRTP